MKPDEQTIISLAIGIFYFFLAVSIDAIQMKKFKKADNRQPKWYPRYLNPD